MTQCITCSTDRLGVKALKLVKKPLLQLVHSLVLPLIIVTDVNRCL